MSAPEAIASDNEIDAPVDAEIRKCLDLADPKSFFLFAGTGSGKTRSLVLALQYICDTFGETLRLRGQRVAVITYTNAASQEIKRRLAFDPIIDVSTIHSFAWSLTNGLNRDICKWLRSDIAKDIAQLQADEAKGRKGTAVSARSPRRPNVFRTWIASNALCIAPPEETVDGIQLNHAEVINLTSYFLMTKPAMQSILVGRYPILLIDESQDTNKHLIDALFAVQTQHKEAFVLGLLGDTMQRIYSDGKDGLGNDLPTDWATPGKQMNHRCPKRVVTLINKVRSATDKQVQLPRSDSIEGSVRLFILSGDIADKPAAEQVIALHMAKVTGDEAMISGKT